MSYGATDFCGAGYYKQVAPTELQEGANGAVPSTLIFSATMRS